MDDDTLKKVLDGFSERALFGGDTVLRYAVLHGSEHDTRRACGQRGNGADRGGADFVRTFVYGVRYALYCYKERAYKSV